MLFDRLDSLRQTAFSAHILQKLLVADALEGGTVRRKPQISKPFDLLEKARSHHDIHTAVNAPVQLFSVIRQDKEGSIINRRTLPLLCIMGRNGRSVQRIILQRPNHPPHIVGVNLFGRSRIHRL